MNSSDRERRDAFGNWLSGSPQPVQPSQSLPVKEQDRATDVMRVTRGHNSLTRITLTGGLMGIDKSKEDALQVGMERLNSSGFRVVLIIRDDFTLREEILYLLILILTLFVWTRSPGYLIIGERAETSTR